VTAAIGALATVCALVAGCDSAVGIGGTPTVSKNDLQTDIAARLAEAGEQPQSVTCKEDLIGEIGKSARCEVVMSATSAPAASRAGPETPSIARWSPVKKRLRTP
jgi:hypothetical protein